MLIITHDWSSRW